jgi:hypothetical protein
VACEDKGAESNDDGVAAGFSVLDSVVLVECISLIVWEMCKLHLLS